MVRRILTLATLATLAGCTLGPTRHELAAACDSGQQSACLELQSRLAESNAWSDYLIQRGDNMTARHMAELDQPMMQITPPPKPVIIQPFGQGWMAQ